jgi:uncharacterized protein (DUF1330 family)
VRERTVIIEFESYESARAAYTTASRFQEALRALGNNVERDLRIVKGLGDPE